MINLIDVTVTNETMNKFLNEYSMDDIIHSKYGYRKANKIDNMVHKITNQKLNDGQFDECDISMKELMVVATVYIKILSSMFHSRIEYPENIVETEAR